MKPSPRSVAFALTLPPLLVVLHAQHESSQQSPEPFRFKGGVEVINVSATVSDDNGRFVRNLKMEDFTVYEDGRPQVLSHFSAERVPVSLGIVLDTSGSMAGDRIRAAQKALNRFLYDLLEPTDEIFLYRFSDRPSLVQGWTMNHQQVRRALGRIVPEGGTAMNDAIAEAVALLPTGRHKKKAVVLLSDGNDTASTKKRRDVQRLIRESETLVYALGIECGVESRRSSWIPGFLPLGPTPTASALQPGGRRWPLPPAPRATPPQPQGRSWNEECGERVDARALRHMTDDSGGRTEVVRNALDLDLATAGIADELSQQYYLGYVSDAKKDGRWHAIRVEVRNRDYRVRARRGYFSS
jgi:VWFA-related protein